MSHVLTNRCKHSRPLGAAGALMGLVLTLILEFLPARGATLDFEFGDFEFGPVTIGENFIEDADWIPNGHHLGHPRPECRHLPEDLKANISSASDWSRAAERHLEDCESDLRHKMPAVPLSQLTQIQYPLHLNPALKSVTWTLGSQERLTGLWAFQQKPAPLVMIKCGIFCNANDTANVRTLLLQWYHDHGFHVVILSNSTGSDFARDNQSLVFGGLIDGLQLLEVSEQIRSSRWQELITSIHFAGVSLGGNAALIATAFADRHRELYHPPSSTLAICPVVNLERTYEAFYEFGIIKRLFQNLLVAQLRKIFDWVPVLGEVIGSLERLNRRSAKNAVVAATLDYYERRGFYFSGNTKQLEQELWHLNDFKLYVDRVQTPTYVLHALDDPLVEAKWNSTPLKNQLKHFPNPQVGVIETQSGSHCAFESAYGWTQIGEILTATLKRHTSTESSTTDIPKEITPPDWFQRIAIDFPAEPVIKGAPRLIHTDTEIIKDLENGQLSLKLSFFKLNYNFPTRRQAHKSQRFIHKRCRLSRLWQGDPACYQNFRWPLPPELSQICEKASRTDWLKQFQCQNHLRILNSRVQTLDAEGHPTLGKAIKPKFVDFKNF